MQCEGMIVLLYCSIQRTHKFSLVHLGCVFGVGLRQESAPEQEHEEEDEDNGQDDGQDDDEEHPDGQDGAGGGEDTEEGFSSDRATVELMVCVCLCACGRERETCLYSIGHVLAYLYLACSALNGTADLASCGV